MIFEFFIIFILLRHVSLGHCLVAPSVFFGFLHTLPTYLETGYRCFATQFVQHTFPRSERRKYIISSSQSCLLLVYNGKNKTQLSTVFALTNYRFNLCFVYFYRGVGDKFLTNLNRKRLTNYMDECIRNSLRYGFPQILYFFFILFSLGFCFVHNTAFLHTSLSQLLPLYTPSWHKCCQYSFFPSKRFLLMLSKGMKSKYYCQKFLLQ